jgi:TIR domain
MITGKTKIFLSHASEDKPFVEQLYAALKDEFDVWYDKGRITLGDSIYEKISEGIRECDFGVVVFSPHFLRKNWTQEELNGFKALQSAQRKVILPILHNLSVEELKAKWPIEAAKLAVSSSEDLKAIVAAIRAAVGVDAQNKDFDKQEIKELFNNFATERKLARINETLSRDVSGAEKAREAAQGLLYLILQKVRELQKSTDLAADSEFISASGGHIRGQSVGRRLLVSLEYEDYATVIEYFNPISNGTTEARLSITFIKFAPHSMAWTPIREHVLFPLFSLSESVVWGFDDPKAGELSDQVANKIIKDFIDFLKEMNDQKEK